MRSATAQGLALAIALLSCLPLASQDPPAEPETPEPFEEEGEEEPTRALLEWWLEDLTIDVKTLEGEDAGVGIDVDWNKEISELYRSTGSIDFGVLTSLEVEGRFGTASENSDNTPRALVLRPNIFTHWRLADIQEFDQTIDVGLSPVMIEADQEFDTVNYGFEAYLSAPIPYSWWLSRGFHRLFGEPTRPLVKPVFVRAGWTTIREIEDENDRDTRGRFELGLSTRILVRDTVGVNIDARHFFEEGGETFGFIEVEADLPIGEHTRLEISYTDGRLPVSPAATHSLSLGVSLEF